MAASVTNKFSLFQFTVDCHIPAVWTLVW